jgi:hypothetical protein
VAGNGNTGKFIVIRVARDEERIAEIEAEGESVLAIKPMDTGLVFDFTGEEAAKIQAKNNETNVWED